MQRKKTQNQTITPGVIRIIRKSKTISFFLDNWFLTIFFACIAFVGAVSVYKLLIKQENFVYARVKVSQGLWWASTQKPPNWLASSLKAGMIEKDLTGAPKAKILSVRSYPYWNNGYDVYLTLKLKVTGRLKAGTVNFNRSTLAVGSPIEHTFPKVEITGTVIELSSKPFVENTKWQTITLVKPNAYQWEYDAIRVGDFYHDGQEKVFEILDKQINANPSYYLGNNLGAIYSEPRNVLTVKAKIKTQLNTNGLLYGFEQELKLGKVINLSTNNFYFQDYQISSLLK